MFAVGLVSMFFMYFILPAVSLVVDCQEKHISESEMTIEWDGKLYTHSLTQTRLPPKRNARNASDCVWIETGL